MLRIALLWLLLLVGGCMTYRSELYRGQRYYEENRYEAALALWRALEANQEALSPSEQVRYAYLRGMTDYRLGYRTDARYWLSLAVAGEQLRPASLTTEFKQRLHEALDDLSQDHLGGSEDIQIERSGVPPAQDPAGAPCQWTKECAQGYVCIDGVCVEL